MAVILITGAAGFIGRATVEQARARGHEVRALIRSPANFASDISIFEADLTTPEPTLTDALTGVDAVIHCAAALSSDPAIWQRDTVQATQNLLTALTAIAPQARLVLLSSIVVYDAAAPRICATTALEPHPQTRDGYTRSKCAQEALLAGLPNPHWIARPGAVFGPGRAWNSHHLGPRIGPLLLLLGRGEQPIIDVTSCAEALVRAAETPPTAANTLLLTASDLPSPRAYLRALGPAAPRLVLPLPWRALAALGRLFSGLPGLPGLLRPRILRARMGPKRYDNSAAITALGWQPAPWRTALGEALK